MLVTVEQSVLTDVYKLKTEVKNLIDELSGYMYDLPLAANPRIYESVKKLENLICEGTERG